MGESILTEGFAASSTKWMPKGTVLTLCAMLRCGLNRALCIRAVSLVQIPGRRTWGLADP